VAFLKLASRCFFVPFLVGAGCSLALDTDSLQQGTRSTGSGGAGGEEAGTDSESASDALDAPVCPEPGLDPCSQCQASNCCPESSDCAHETRCNLAMVALQQCRRDARLGDNSRSAIMACNASFVQNGGARASAVLMCMVDHCMAACGGA
jgi:hypothetical protein